MGPKTLLGQVLVTRTTDMNEGVGSQPSLWGAGGSRVLGTVLRDIGNDFISYANVTKPQQKLWTPKASVVSYSVKTDEPRG